MSKFSSRRLPVDLLLTGTVLVFAVSGLFTPAHAAENLPTKAATGPALKTIVVVGDSLSAEYGIARGSGWVALLQNDIDQRKLPYKVRNASISGDTTSGGRSRLPALLKDKPNIVILELGSNDALRGLSLSTSRDNLTEMTRSIQASGAQMVLVGMQIPPNYGKQYTMQFEAMFRNLAVDTHVAFVPFLLQGVADNDSLFQADRLHPLAAAHPIILKNILPVLNPLLKPQKHKT